MQHDCGGSSVHCLMAKDFEWESIHSSAHNEEIRRCEEGLWLVMGQFPSSLLTYNNPARPRREHLQQRTCWQALYQACPPPSSAQEKRARGRSICGSAGLERFWSGF